MRKLKVILVTFYISLFLICVHGMDLPWERNDWLTTTATVTIASTPVEHVYSDYVDREDILHSANRSLYSDESMVVCADDLFSMTLVDDQKQFPYTIEFSKEESEGRIRTFDVSESGQVATQLHTWKVNVYDDVRFSYSIYPHYSHCTPTVKWNGDVLVIYVEIPDAYWNNEYFAIKVYGFEDFEVYSIPETKENERLWDSLSFDTKELEINGNHYFMSEGNLLYTENGSEGTLYIADSGYFHPAILSLPIVLPLCIYVFVKRKELFESDAATKR